VWNSSSFIVAFDTSTRRGSIALAAGGCLVAEYGLETDAPQSDGLWRNLDMLMVQAGRTVRDVTAVAVATGPGSFTGLRVGMAAALGLSRAIDRPLYGATTFDLTALSCGAAADVWVLLNAHRGEVYARNVSVGRDGRVEHGPEPLVAAPEAVFALFGGGPLRVTGDTEYFGERLEREAAERGIALERPAVVAPPMAGWQVVRPSAFLAGELAGLAFRLESAGRPPGDVEPCYVRPSQAEVNRLGGRTPANKGGGL
jgi:tRNA threonylcarbamoyladenosine biosynthesis protein TsaB